MTITTTLETTTIATRTGKSRHGYWKGHGLKTFCGVDKRRANAERRHFRELIEVDGEITCKACLKSMRLASQFHAVTVARTWQGDEREFEVWGSSRIELEEAVGSMLTTARDALVEITGPESHNQLIEIDNNPATKAA